MIGMMRRTGTKHNAWVPERTMMESCKQQNGEVPTTKSKYKQYKLL